MVTKRRKGFTLVELVIVIAVIAILASILIPTFMTVVEKSRYSADIQAARNMSTLAKTAAINGATDASGNDMDISMNEPRGVIAFLKANGNSLDPKSKDSAFWYDRATGDVKIIKNDDMFKKGGSAEKLSAALPIKPLAATDEKKFTQDCLEALSKDNPAYVYIDQSPKAPVSVAINTINNLVKATDIPTVAMKTAFDTNITNNDKLKKVLNYGKDTATDTFNRLTKFSPDSCLYVTNLGSYTSSTAPKLENVIFVEGTTTFGAPTAEVTNVSFLVDKINIPVAIKDFADNAMAKFDPKSQVIVNRQYDAIAIAKSGCSATVVDNTGKIQITYKNLKYNNSSYNQYGSRFYNYTVDTVAPTDLTKDTTNYMSNFSMLQTFDPLIVPLADTLITKANDLKSSPAYTRTETAGKTYQKLLSVYAVPNISIDCLLTNAGEVVTLNPSDGTSITMTFSYYSKNIGNLTVMYGSIIAIDNDQKTSVTYKIQDIAYIKAVSTYTINKSSGLTFGVSDPLAGGYYNNLLGITVEAVDDKGGIHSMKQQESGSSKGDFELKADASNTLPKIEKVYVRDTHKNIILVQYI